MDRRLLQGIMHLVFSSALPRIRIAFPILISIAAFLDFKKIRLPHLQGFPVLKKALLGLVNPHPPREKSGG